MKTIKDITIVLFALIVSSCSFLEGDPLDKLPIDKLFATVDGADAAVVGCYSYMKAQSNGFYNVERIISAEEDTDVMAPGDEAYNWTSSDQRWADWWLSTYAAIGACNQCITRLESSPIPDKDKTLLMAEAKFMRAFYYYHAYTDWGDVPLITTEVTNIEQVNNIKRTPAKEVLEFMINDLKDEIVPNISEKPVVVGRAGKGAALALLAKLYMINKDWKEAVDCCDAIQKLGYDLMPEYSQVFSQKFENNAEQIFSIAYAPDDVYKASRLLWYTGPSLKEWDKFDGLGGLGICRKFYELYDPWDSRLEQNFAETWRGQPWSNGRIAILKYWDRFSPQSKTIDGLDFPVYRYADVLLMQAEALNELNSSPNAEAYKAINRVRERAYIDPVDNLTYEKFKQLIYDERAKELCFEGHRRFDLVRWGILEKVVKETAKEYGSKAEQNIKPCHNLYPVPDTEIMKNNNLRPNNPGY